MQKLVTIAMIAALSGAIATPVLAEGGVTGAELGFAWTGFAEGNMRRQNNLALEGALEYGFTPVFATQLDVATHHFTDNDREANKVTLHAIGHLNEGTAIGGYLGQEWVFGNHMEHYGLEATHDFGLVTVEGTAELIQNDGNDAKVTALSGDYAMNDALSLGARFENVNADVGADTTALDATLGYALPSGVKLDGSLGLIDGNRMDREITFGLGVKFAMGGRGVTFAQRGLAQTYPGH